MIAMATKDLADIIIKALTAGVGLATLIWTVLKYFRDRKDDRDLRRVDLAWRKTQFLVELSQAVDTDERFNRAMMLIDHEPEKTTALLDADPASLSKAQRELWHALDRYCDFFDRLYQLVFQTRSLELCDVAGFSGYVQTLCGLPGFADFAETIGYQDVLALNERFTKMKCSQS